MSDEMSFCNSPLCINFTDNLSGYCDDCEDKYEVDVE